MCPHVETSIRLILTLVAVAAGADIRLSHWGAVPSAVSPTGESNLWLQVNFKQEP